MKFLYVLSLLFSVSISVWAQSSDQTFPTPVRSSEILGSVAARAMGDSRLTSYYYTFEGGQGDIFINVVTSNFTGDIDVYLADSLQPLTKIVLYADRGTNETGRIVYLRQPARILLRVQGRSPNDDSASFRLKFAGSFIASTLPDSDDAPVVDSSSRARANSVEKVVEDLADDSDKKDSIRTDVRERDRVAEGKDTVADPSPERTNRSVEEKPDTKPRVIVSPAPEVRTVIGGRSTNTRRANERTSTTVDRSRSTPSPETRPAPPADPLASIKLVILTKDGGVIEHPMSEVVRFSVDKGMLTLVVKDGKTNRYSILNVQRVTIE